MSKELASLIARTDKSLNGLEDKAIAQMNMALLNLYKDLEKQLLATYPKYTSEAQPGLLANQRSLLLFNELKTVLGQAAPPGFQAVIEKLYDETLSTATAEGLTLSDELMKLRGGDSFVTSTAKIPIEVVAEAAKNAADLVVGKTQEFKTEAKYLITQGLATGAGGRKIATQLRQRLGVTKGRAEAIARTEVNRAQNNAAKANYKANGLDFFQLIATADGRLCPYCGDRNGGVYRLEDLQVPIHIFCRCYAAPFSPQWEDEGLTSDKWVRDFHDEGVAILAEKGVKLNKGPTYFERKAGMTTAPKPVWSPGAGWIADKQKLLGEDPVAIAQKKAQATAKKKAQATAKKKAEAAAQKKAEAAAKKKAEEIAQKKADAAAKKQPEAAAKETKPKKVETQKKPTRQTLLFPKDVDNLEEVKGLGGSTGAKLVRDPKTGKQYVLKRGGSEGHLREEINADAAYQAMGVAVPKFKLYETTDGPVKLAEFIEGKPLSALSGKAKESAVKKLQKDFAADALLGNWDVVGMTGDNVLVSADGKVYRIDNGGSLRYRAQGALKKGAWNKYPHELWTLRDRAVNTQTAEAFENLSISDIAKQIDRLGKKQEKLLTALPPELHKTVSARLDELMQTAYVAKTLKADKFKDSYTDGFTKHGMGIRSAGITDRLPEELKQKSSGSVAVVDENGKAFDHLRGKDSIIGDLKQYIDSQGGSYRSLEYWMSAQAGDSWSYNSQSLKWYLAQQRDVPMKNYWWKNGPDNSKELYESITQKAGGESVHNTSIQALHAFNYEMMRSVKFAKRDEKTETVKLMRTEADVVMSMNDLHVGDRNIRINRGVAESTSIFKEVKVFGSELTVQDVPWHRVIGTYFQERSPGRGGSAFMGDSENEFVVMLDDIPFDYVKGKRKKKKKKE